MPSVLARRIVEQGLDNINVSMLSNKTKCKVLTEAALIFLKKGNIPACIKSLSLGKNFTKLEDIGDTYLSQQNIELAALFFIASKNVKKTESIAKTCLEKGKIKLAYSAYQKLNDAKMCSFLKENFL